MVIPLFDNPTPGSCEHETKSVAMNSDGGNVKSKCDKMGCWTNCREVGRCLAVVDK
jgi:hypothetical protein